ncbi:MAG TPA: zinc ABC transporter substrate-binding protein [Candidatus Paceibacterota bacterium]|jgi:zinc/manganese transport system substrate-binding protein|nr:zinc ABC transporter substrate-binding protein [Candidatus Paceibacterota bacterium]
MYSKTTIWLIVAVILIVLAGIVYTVSRNGDSSPTPTSTSGSKMLQVVAAENFWGSVVSQIGGSHVRVLSIVSDPNADPHEYESSAADARAVANADYVIENGVGYDSWVEKLLSAGSSYPNRKVLDVGELVGVSDGGNPHLWYNPAYVNQTATKIEQDLISLDPADKADFEKNYATLQSNFGEYQNRISAIKQQYAGIEVASTESIFVFLANAAGLDLVSPPAFIDAVAEGNDPSAQSVVQFENQLKSGNVKILVYNEQTVTPLTQEMKALAAQEGIPVIGVTETIQPPDATFQEWMNAELIDLQNALNANQLGQ